MGASGSIANDLNIGDIVIGKYVVQHDFDITAFNHKLGYIPNIGIYINSDNHLVNLSKKILKNNNYTFYIGTIASGDIFCTNKKQSNKIANEFEALCVEMEGATIGAVSEKFGIDAFTFYYAGDNLDATQWDERSLKGLVNFDKKKEVALLAFELALRI